MFSSNNHWRNTARPVRFFNLDYRAGAFVFIFMMHIRLWTFVLMLAVFVVLIILERKGLTLPLAMRRGRIWLIGAKRPAQPKLFQRSFWDHGGI
jgi:intracellular multiplication protein IcmT